MTTRIAINGFGRIGRAIVRRILATDASDLALVAINDLADGATLAHLLAFDSVHGRLSQEVTVEGETLRAGPIEAKLLREPDPAALPWGALDVDLVLECSGRFRSQEEASKHLRAGAKRVVISAPAKGDVDATVVMGLNDDALDGDEVRIISNASCTTNNVAPLLHVLDSVFGVEKAHMQTVHSYTADQNLHDAPHRRDRRRARAAAMSMIPTSTGAADAVVRILPQLAGRFSGSAVRVPTPNVSMTTLTAHLAEEASAERINQAFVDAANGPLAGILRVETRPLVSIDYVGEPASCVLDAELTQVVGGDLVQLTAWYDNESGFAARMVDLARRLTGNGSDD